MAKQWNPTEKQLSVYEETLKKYNKLRKQIIKAHHSLEKITPSGRMPSLVVPERQRKMSLRQIRLSGRQVFNLKIRQLKKVVHGGLQAFYSDYKKSYLELYRNYIIQDLPEGYQGRFYSEFQIKEADPEMAQFMHDYNSLVNMNGVVFAFLVKSGRLPEFRYLYAQFVQDFSTYDNYGYKFHKAIKLSRYISKNDALSVLGEADWSRRSKNLQRLYKKSFEVEKTLKDYED